MSHTHTTVFGDAPCGCRIAVPHIAYAEPFLLEPCSHHLRWVIAVVDADLRWAREAAIALARVFHAAYEAIAPGLGYTTRRATSVPWDQLGPASKLLMILTAEQVLSSGVVVAGPGPDAIGLPDPAQGELELDGAAAMPTDPIAGSPVARCSACQAPILWREHVGTGKRAPIDLASTPDGNVLLVAPSAYTVISPGGTFPEGEPRFTNHFQTCPNADRFRGGR